MSCSPNNVQKLINFFHRELYGPVARTGSVPAPVLSIFGESLLLSSLYPLTPDIVLASFAKRSAYPIIQWPPCQQYIHVVGVVLDDWAHSYNGLAANGVGLLAVVTGATTAFTVYSAAICHCITTGLPAPFQPFPLTLLWYPPRVTKLAPHRHMRTSHPSTE